MLKLIFAVIMVLGGLALAAWLSIYVMLYGGIMAAIDNWGSDTGATVWGIIRAVLFECGLIPGYILIAIGITPYKE